jgi:GT2 family glycosyltransferase
MSPKVFSIVIPTRRRDETLRRCLTLLAPQLDDAVEVIVTDDGRSDSTRALIASEFPFATWTPGPQRGPGANRNHGASLARGEYILFVDDDVEPAAGFLAGYRSSLRDDVSVYEGRTTCRAGLHSPLEHAPINETGGWLWSCNMMVRRSLWESIGGFDEDFRFPHLEDVVLRERIKQMGARMLFVPAATVDHPPRRLAPPHVLAQYHEADFIYEYKYLGRAPSVPRFFAGFLRHRAAMVMRHRLSLDSVVAFRDILAESFHILGHWRAWHRRWAAAKRAPVELREPWRAAKAPP